MILILSGPSDETSCRFGKWLNVRGISNRVVTEMNELAITVKSTRNHESASSIALWGGERASAVLNRFVPRASGFLGLENYAALWATLALFDGPCINRPSHIGYYDSSGFRSPSRGYWIACDCEVSPPRVEGVVENVHSIATGRFLGRADSLSSIESCMRYTAYSPADVTHELRAGRDAYVFDRSTQRWAREGSGRKLDYFSFSMTIRDGANSILGASAFPGWWHFSDDQELIFGSLAEALIG